MALVSGARLGPYEILSPIGAGGMGAVYRARDTRLGRDVAIKVIADKDGGMSDLIPRFKREAQAVAALNHPNILALHDIGDDGGVVYAVTELLEGETLRSRLQSAGRLPPLKAIEYAVQIAQGLAAAHERGIVHRDLKPDNLFITRDGRVKILDFGLAQQEAAADATFDSQETRFTTGTNVVMGTLGYIAPEQMIGQAATARSDIFAFGVVVYEMLTGLHPFRRATASGTTAAVLRDDPPSLVTAVPGLPTAIAAILERCVQKQPSDRPAAASDLVLFFHATGTVANETVANPAIDATRISNTNRRVLAISCGLLILLCVATWGFVRVMADRTVAATLDADLAGAERVVQRAERERLTAVALTARLVASFPELKALFATDAPTIRDFLLTYQQRNPEVPVLMALGPDGSVMARTDELAPTGDGNDAVSALVAKPGEAAMVEIRGRPHHAAAAVSDAGGTIFGYVIGAMPVDEAFAASLREATQDEVVLLGNSGVLASTLRSMQTPWPSLDEWRRAGGRSDQSIDVTIGSQQFAAREVVLADAPLLSAIVLKSRDEAMEPFRQMQNGVMLIGVLCALVAVAGSIWIWRVQRL